MLHLRLVLVSTALLLALALQADAASFAFSECVGNCVASSGCESKDTKCVCKEAKGTFLETVVTCMYYHCKDDFRGVDNLFFGPAKSGCDADKKPVPKAEFDTAKKVASSLVAKLPKTTTSTAISRALPIPTTTSKTASLSTTSSTSTGSPSEASATTPLVLPPTLPAATSLPGSTTTTFRQGAVPTDSSPFATFNSPSSRVEIQWLMLSLPFIISLALR